MGLDSFFIGLKMTFRQNRDRDRPASSDSSAPPITGRHRALTTVFHRLVIAVSLTALPLLTGCGEDPLAENSMQPKLAHVKLLQPQQQSSYSVSHFYTADVVPRRESLLSFQRAGQVVRVQVDEGDRVEQNQVLAWLDRRHLMAQRTKLRAELAQGRHRLSELENGPREQTIRAAQAQVDDLKQQLTGAANHRERNKELYDRNAISDRKYEQALFEHGALQARLRAAQSRLEELQAGTRQEKIDAQKSVINVIQASLDSVQLDLDDCQLEAPFTGLVTRRLLDEGAMADPSTPVLELIEVHQLEIHSGLPLSVAQSLNPGDLIRFESEQGEGWAEVQSVVNEIAPSTQTAKAILVQCPPPDAQDPGDPGENSARPAGARSETALRSVAPFGIYTSVPRSAAADRAEDVSSNGVDLVPGQTVRLEFKDKHPVAGFWVPTSSLIGDHHGLWSCFVAIPWASDGSESAPTGSLDNGGRRLAGTPDSTRRLVRQTVEVIHRDNRRAFIRGTLQDGQWIVADGVQRLVNGQRVVGEAAAGPNND